MRKTTRFIPLALVCLGVTACGGDRNATQQQAQLETPKKRQTIWDLFASPDANTNIRVNKYIWNASLDILSFLPLENADPFSGVMVMGWGQAPGSRQVYRATVYVQDPALDARSLRLSLLRRSGSSSVPASAETIRQIEDAILTRARQLLQADAQL